MSDIFLSYASSDREKAQAIAMGFMDAGFDVFFDKNIPAGLKFEDVIERELDNATAVVVLWSAESVNSQWIRREAQVGLDRNVLLPVLIEPVAMPLSFRAVPAADLTEWRGQPEHPAFKELVEAVLTLRGTAGTSAEPAPSTPAPAAQRGRWIGALRKLFSSGSAADRATTTTSASTTSGVPEARREYDIFLSYRRSDSAYATGHISEYLEKRFGKGRIFKDVDAIGLGEDFRQSVDDAVADCQIMVAVIGKRWTGVRDDGTRRIDEQRDLVRIELESALKRSVSLVPVLIEGVTLPPEQSLPETLKTLPYLNGAEVRPDPDFNGDVERLMNGLETLLKKETI